MHTTYALIKVSLLTCLAVLIGACASGPKPEVDYKSDYDFSGVSTFSFYERSGAISGDNPLQLSDFQKARVDEALKLAMEAKSLTFVEDPAAADILLSWHLDTREKTDVRTYQSPSYGGGYGMYNRYAMYSCWSCMQPQTQVSVQNYTKGTFIVDLIDTNLQQSVWRSVTRSRLKGDHSNDQGKYNDAAVIIMAGFPPNRAEQ